MASIEFGCRPTIVGSMPHTDPDQACSDIRRYLKDIPAWPQLPRRSFLENMYVQYSQGFPGVVIDETERKIRVDRSADLNQALGRLYEAFLEDDADRYPITPEYAAGLHSFLAQSDLRPMVAKGQVVGPVTWGLTVTDQEGKGILYDDFLGDAVPKLLRMKAAWQEKQLRNLSPDTIIFVDEPYMSAFGSVSVMLSREKVAGLLEEVFGGIRGLKGVHCCGNTDWSLLLDTSVDIISFDAYNYAQSLGLYPAEIKKFLDRGGTIAWGIIPTDEESLLKETVSSLKDRLEEAMAPFTERDIQFKQLTAQALLTPSCGLSSLPTVAAALRAMELLTELSAEFRKRYI